MGFEILILFCHHEIWFMYIIVHFVTMKYDHQIGSLVTIQVSWSTPLQFNNIYALNKVKILRNMVHKPTFSLLCSFLVSLYAWVVTDIGPVDLHCHWCQYGNIPDTKWRYEAKGKQSRSMKRQEQGRQDNQSISMKSYQRRHIKPYYRTSEQERRSYMQGGFWKTLPSKRSHIGARGATGEVI